MSKNKKSFSLSLLRYFCPPHLLEEIEGDLLQKLEHDVKSLGERKAKRRLLWNVVRFFRPGILLRNKFSHQLNSTAMLQNYLKITLRNLNKRRAYAFINVLGLAVGISVCLVIGKYVEFETSFETFNANAKNIYRAVSSFYTDGKIESYCGYDLGPSLAESFPEIKRFARIHGNGSIVTVGAESQKQLKFKELNMLIVDSTFFDIFSFAFLNGNSKLALAKPNLVVITKSIAIKYFGEDDPIGKTISLEDGWIPGVYEVSAVIEDAPSNTHFKFDLLLPMHNLLQTDFYRNDHARWDNFHTYLELYPSVDISQLNNRITAFEKKYRGEDQSIKKSNLQFQPLLDEWKKVAGIDADSLVNTLGNLTLLSGEKNISASNNSFEQKISTYNGNGLYGKEEKGITSFRITQKIVDDYKSSKAGQEWNAATILARKKWLLGEIEKMFDIKIPEYQ